MERVGLCVVAFLVLTGAGMGVEIIGHRGASHDAPENTVASVRLAWAQGADAAEIDVWLTKDARIVALHDETTERTTGKNWRVGDRTLAELATLDAGSWKGPQFAGEPIPTLEDVLETVPPGKRLVIEIKCGPEIVPHLKEVLGRCKKSPAQIVLIAFGYETICRSKQAMPEIPAYWLFGTSPKVDEETGAKSDWPEELAVKAARAGLDGIDIKYDSKITRDFTDKLRADGMELLVYTVNDAEVARRLAAAGVAGITTDRPGWLRAQLAEKGE